VSDHPARVTVVGNGVAGYACAARLAAAAVPVTLIGPGLPCDRPPLSKRALVTGRVPHLATHDQLAASGIRHLDGWADTVDMDRRTLVVRPRASGDPVSLDFGRLVWATGLRPASPPVPGMRRADQNADPAGLEKLLPRLSRPGRKVVVIGAGLIGAETAATLAARHRVTLLERGDRPLGRFLPQVGAAAERALAESGVTFAAGCGIDVIEPAGRGGSIVRTATHGTIHADVVIAAAGVASTVPPGLGSDAVLSTDERLACVGLESVWTCGDLARFPHPRFGPIAIPHWDNARAGGTHVADAIMGCREPYRRDPYWFSDLGRLRIQQVGFAPAATEWSQRDGLHIGHAHDGRPACVLLIDAPNRLNEARRLLAA
jgi:3-phenylpropionate/trans-cinnamate dioxygenase ferredoxin reductase subunit